MGAGHEPSHPLHFLGAVLPSSIFRSVPCLRATPLWPTCEHPPNSLQNGPAMDMALPMSHWLLLFVCAVLCLDARHQNPPLQPSAARPGNASIETEHSSMFALSGDLRLGDPMCVPKYGMETHNSVLMWDDFTAKVCVMQKETVLRRLRLEFPPPPPNSPT